MEGKKKESVKGGDKKTKKLEKAKWQEMKEKKLGKLSEQRTTGKGRDRIHKFCLVRLFTFFLFFIYFFLPLDQKVLKFCIAAFGNLKLN